MDKPADNPKPKTYISQLRMDLKFFKGKKHDKSETWKIFDPVTDKYYTISEKEHVIISKLHKKQDIEELFNSLKSYTILSKKDILEVLAFLRTRNLFVTEYMVTEKQLSKQKVSKSKVIKNAILYKYLFIFIPIWNPDKFLNKTKHVVFSIFNKKVLWFFSAIALCGYISVIIHWHKFTSTILASLNYSGMLKYMIMIVVIKVFHEFSHAYAASLYGVRVRKFGVGFIFFMPRLYTDLTDSWRISKQRQRLFIDSAGIISELIISGFAALIWVYSGPGVIKTIAYFTFTVTMINTLLINGNPFLKWDGYYILIDITGIDNLMKISSQEIKDWFRKYCFGVEIANKTKTKTIYRLLLILYGVSCFIYRFFLYTGIILLIYFKFTKALGIILAIMEVYVLFIMPMKMEYKMLSKLKKKKKNTLITLSTVIIILLFVFIPLPWRLIMPGEAMPSNYRIIFTHTSGELKKFDVPNNSYVKKGQFITTQQNPILEADLKKLNIKLNELNIELDQMHSRGILDGLNIQKVKINNIQINIKELKRKLSDLKIYSPINGTFVLLDRNLKIGKWLKEGENIGEVYSKGRMKIYAYANEDQIDKLQLGDSVKIYVDGQIRAIKGKIANIKSTPEKTWYFSPLLSTAGGPLQVVRKKSLNTFILKERYYRVTIKPLVDLGDKFVIGRTGTIELRKYSSPGLNFIREVLSVFYREFSF